MEAARAAVHDNVPLEVVAADIARVVAETMFGDPSAVDVARAMARGAAREYAAARASHG